MTAQEETPRASARVAQISDDPVNLAWQRFSRAGTAQEFCQGWLDVQCNSVPKARSGLVVLRSDSGEFAPAAQWAAKGKAETDHLVSVIEKALNSETGLMEPGPDGTVLLAYPVRIKAELFGAVVIEVGEMPAPDLRRAFINASWGAGWLEVLFRRRQADADGAEVRATRLALDLTVTAMEQEFLNAAAIALVNQAVDKLGARSAALAMRDGRKLRMLAFSRTAWFQKRSFLSVAVLEAMEESIDQLEAVSYPEVPGATETIHVAHKKLADATKAGVIMSAPLMDVGKPVGSLLLEFDPETTPRPDTPLLLATIGAISGSTMADKLRQNRWFAGRVPRWIGKTARDLANPRRIAGKIVFLLIIAGIFALATAKAPLRVTANAVVEGTIQRAVVSPVDGFLDTSDRRPGDIVNSGDVLAQLDDRDLQLEVLRLESERSRAEGEYRDALAQQDSLETALQTATIEETEAQLRLVRLQRDRLTIRAPIDGVIVSGDLTRDLGTPIEKGQQLFEIAPLGSYRVILQVDERDVLLVEPGQEGLLSLEAIEGNRLPVEVVSVTPVSTPEDGRNFFRVEAEILEQDAPLRPGMEGVGKVVIREESLVWVWTRPLVNWLRIQAWSWLP